VKAVASASVSSTQTVEAKVFRELVEAVNLRSHVDISATQHGNGLAALKAVKKGEVLLSVPRALSIVLDYKAGLQIAEGQWPRLQEGAGRDDPEPLTWDLLMALALMDALAGDGDAFWGAWAQAVLPPPEALCLPMCWSAQRLGALQHDAIVDGATKQQARLKRLFPALCDPVDLDSCSWLAWAFACVRSRSLRLGDDMFAFVPFLDMANHAHKPNAAFRLDEASGAIELVALGDVAPGDEVTISYSGPEGLTNQRFMAQYGFVPTGNPADRIAFDLPEELRPVPGGLVAGGLNLERIQDRLGDALFMEALSAKNPYTHAALKSFPMAREPEEQAAAAAAAPASGPGSQAVMSDMQLAKTLRDQCHAMLDVLPTNLDDDEEALKKAGADKGSDPRDVAALAYRVERKRLLRAAITLLDIYLRA